VLWLCHSILELIVATHLQQVGIFRQELVADDAAAMILRFEVGILSKSSGMRIQAASK